VDGSSPRVIGTVLMSAGNHGGVTWRPSPFPRNVVPFPSFTLQSKGTQRLCMASSDSSSNGISSVGLDPTIAPYSYGIVDTLLRAEGLEDIPVDVFSALLASRLAAEGLQTSTLEPASEVESVDLLLGAVSAPIVAGEGASGDLFRAILSREIPDVELILD